MKHVIIGVGAAGITAARTIRERQPLSEIVMISSDTYVHSRCMLHRYLSHERDEKGLSFIPDDFFETNRITWLSGKTVTEVLPEEHQLLLEGEEKPLTYDKLLISTGADSFLPPVGDFRQASNVFGLRHLSDAQNINALARDAKRILIVGSGLVGMDAAYAFLEQKKEVTVVEMADRILPLQLDETAGGTYRKLFEEAGCRFLLGRKASETVMENGKITRVLLDDGTELSCDLVIVAAGVRPALGCVQGSSLKADRFLEVDRYLRTSDPDVYAAGDVTGLSGIWPNAMKQGQTAALNMCGISMMYLDRYAMKNTMNFYGVTTLSLGRGVAEEGDEVILCQDQNRYQKAILRNGKLDSILLQGPIDYSGIYQYLIKNQVDISDKKERIFDLSFADFYGIMEDGQYLWSV